MHDRHRQPLKKGDLVMVPCIVTELNETEEYCNVSLTTVYGRRPDDMKEGIYAINTAVIVRV